MLLINSSFKLDVVSAALGSITSAQLKVARPGNRSTPTTVQATVVAFNATLTIIAPWFSDSAE